MKEFNEKMKKEYATPQMDVLDYEVQGFLCSSGGDVELCTPGDPDCAN